MSFKIPRKPIVRSTSSLIVDEETPLDKHRKPVIHGRTTMSSLRQPLTTMNTAQNTAPTADVAGSDAGSSEEVAFSCREDVERLIGEKMRGKSKMDYKGKSEQMFEYIKKLRACIKWFMELEDGYLAEQEKLKVAAEDSRAKLESTCAEVKCSTDQIKTLQESIRRLREYNNSLQQYNANLQAGAQEQGETILKLQKEKSAMTESSMILRTQLASYKISQEEAVKQSEEVRELRSELRLVRDNCRHHLTQVQSLTAEVATYKELSGKSVKDLNNIMTKHSCLEETCSSQREQIQILNHQLTAANEKLKRADLATDQTLDECEAQKKLVYELQTRVAGAEFQLLEAETFRKKLHNTILELKGNIRVFCRVRPISDRNSTEGAAVSFSTSTEALGRGIELMHNEQKYSFTFDKVFSDTASQEDVFVEISQLVQSALDGYKVCIFAYGQTGSGKTYTMMGNPKAAEQKGLIPRSVEQIFNMSRSLESQGWAFNMEASMLEIYNETIRDLLPGQQGRVDATAGLSKQYTIIHDSNGNTHVSELNTQTVSSTQEVSELLKQAAGSRSVGKTQMNEQSSRSHFMFTLRISGDNKNTMQHVEGILNLIDLAGSERLTKSGATGDRLKETQAINKSLSALSEVFNSIAKKDDHVPFRNSKLTYLLQPCLGGDSKTLMFVNVSPEASSTGESLCSLRFAANVNSCEVGVPRRHTQGRPDARLSYG